jgi:hypothetical protein
MHMPHGRDWRVLGLCEHSQDVFYCDMITCVTTGSGCNTAALLPNSSSLPSLSCSVEKALILRCKLERIEPLQQCAARNTKLRVKPCDALKRWLPLHRRRLPVAKQSALEC